jgi:hypothetical protein
MHLITNGCGSIPLLLGLVGAFNGFRSGCQYESPVKKQAWQGYSKQNYKDWPETGSYRTGQKLLEQRLRS